ncbi:MAG: hypothetical protein ACUVXJ_08280 [Phycisphaerae bacterium]
MAHEIRQHGGVDNAPEKRRGGMPLWLPLAGGLVALGTVIAMAVYVLRNHDTASETTTPVAMNAKTSAKPAPAKAVRTGILIGRWLRTDGNYMLDIKSVGSDGKVEAAYFNPSPVNVSKAEVSSAKGEVQLVIELKDRGYDGNYYTLAYDSDTDCLSGVYHQLTMGQDFDVEFVRMPR